MQQELTTRQIQLVCLNMLKYFDALCRQHNLRYFLSGGTLLGAVRHQGFIPWDDDIDVMMPRPDYQRLLQLTGSAEHPRYRFLMDDGNAYSTPYLRLLDTDTEVHAVSYSIATVPHLFLDIFPIEGLPDDEKQCRAFYKKMRMYDIMYRAVRKKQFMPGERLQALKVVVRACARLTGGSSAWCRRFDRAAQKIEFGTTTHAGVCLIAHYGAREMMPTEVFQGSIPVRFEDAEFPAPVGYDRYLSGLYHDYMQLPPEEKRVSLHRLTCHYAAKHEPGTI